MLSAEDVVLVEVDGRPVTLAMLEFLMESRGVSEDDPEQMRQLLDELIRLRAMANAAEAEGVSTDPKVRAERMIKDIEVQYVRYLEHFQEQNPITDAEIQQVYSQQVQRAGTVRYRLQTIVFDQQSVAVESLNGLLDGTVSFDQEIERAETDGRAVLSPNWVDRSQVPAEVSAALAQTAAGEPVGALMPYQDQWVVARVLETQANTIPSLEEVREGIRRTLAREQNQLLIDDRFDSADIVPMLPLDDAAVDDDNGGE
ncbi:MAG: peptidylprolyl isomerase [Pseudomonadota bacterium]